MREENTKNTPMSGFRVASIKIRNEMLGLITEEIVIAQK